MMMLILSFLKTNAFTKKQNGKKVLFKTNSLDSIKIVLILLIKTIAIYIRFSKVKVRQSSFEELF